MHSWNTFSCRNERQKDVWFVMHAQFNICMMQNSALSMLLIFTVVSVLEKMIVIVILVYSSFLVSSGLALP